MVEEAQPDFYGRLSRAVEGSVENGEIVTKWTVIIELLDEDGDRGLWAVSDEHSSIWDTLGMLDFASQKARSKVDMVTWAQHSVQGDEDDDDE